MLKFKTSCAVLANLSSNLLNEVGLSLFRYFEVGLRVCDIVVNKYVCYLISGWVLVITTTTTTTTAAAATATTTTACTTTTTEINYTYFKIYWNSFLY